MIHTIEINSIESATKLLFDQEYNENISRLRSPFLFRGINNSAYKLQTSLKTNCKNKQYNLEHSILENFTKYAVKNEPDMQDSVWKQMVVGQHFSLPTRLLDWTHSALIALHFATSEWAIRDTGMRDGVVWRIDPRECNRLLPKKYQESLKKRNTSFFNVENLQKVAPDIQTFDMDIQGSGMVFLEPPSIDQRIINQYSYFSIIPQGIDDIEDFLDKNTENTYRYIIRKEIRWNLRDLLDQFNVSERIVYPGLDGLSMWIARHYYVKD